MGGRRKRRHVEWLLQRYFLIVWKQLVVLREQLLLVRKQFVVLQQFLLTGATT
ncbi:hypothetical protein [Streptomyces tibetensis]|uniref:hypothetical protein n=1 Tax=Streptomyces tibetensis TaxID=2382123 RepID=UPI0033CA4879